MEVVFTDLGDTQQSFSTDRTRSQRVQSKEREMPSESVRTEYQDLECKMGNFLGFSSSQYELDFLYFSSHTRLSQMTFLLVWIVGYWNVYFYDMSTTYKAFILIAIVAAALDNILQLFLFVLDRRLLEEEVEKKRNNAWWSEIIMFCGVFLFLLSVVVTPGIRDRCDGHQDESRDSLCVNSIYYPIFPVSIVIGSAFVCTMRWRYNVITIVWGELMYEIGTFIFGSINSSLSQRILETLFRLCTMIIIAIVTYHRETNARNSFQWLVKTQDSQKELEEIQSGLLKLLSSLFPHNVTKRLILHSPVVDVAPKAGVVCVTLTNFSRLIRKSGSNEIVKTLQSMYQTVDNICSTQGMYRVQGWGETFVAVCGLNTQNKPEVNAHIASNFANAVSSQLEFLCSEMPEELNIGVRVVLEQGNAIGMVIGKPLTYVVVGEAIDRAIELLQHCDATGIVLGESISPLLQENVNYITFTQHEEFTVADIPNLYEELLDTIKETDESLELGLLKKEETAIWKSMPTICTVPVELEEKCIVALAFPPEVEANYVHWVRWKQDSTSTSRLVAFEWLAIFAVLLAGFTAVGDHGNKTAAYSLLLVAATFSALFGVIVYRFPSDIAYFIGVFLVAILCELAFWFAPEKSYLSNATVPWMSCLVVPLFVSFVWLNTYLLLCAVIFLIWLPLWLLDPRPIRYTLGYQTMAFFIVFHTLLKRNVEQRRNFLYRSNATLNFAVKVVEQYRLTKLLEATTPPAVFFLLQNGVSKDLKTNVANSVDVAVLLDPMLRMIEGEPVTTPCQEMCFLLLNVDSQTSSDSSQKTQRRIDEVVTTQRILGECLQKKQQLTRLIGNVFMVSSASGEDDMESIVTALALIHFKFEPFKRSLSLTAVIGNGPVMGAVVGTGRITYELFGDPVCAAQQQLIASPSGITTVTAEVLSKIQQGLLPFGSRVDQEFSFPLPGMNTGPTKATVKWSAPTRWKLRQRPQLHVHVLSFTFSDFS